MLGRVSANLCAASASVKRLESSSMRLDRRHFELYYTLRLGQWSWT